MSALTLAAAKTHLNITTATHDVELQAMIDAAEATIASRVGPLVPTTTTARVDGGGSLLLLPVWPVVSLTTVADPSGTALTVADMTLDESTGSVAYTNGANFPSGYLTVTYQAGRTTLPADLALAVKELVRHLWDTQRGPARFPATDGPLDTRGVGYLMPYRVQELLAPHAQAGVA